MKKKLKEIPFNHELIGKEGIFVRYRNGKEVKAIYVLKVSYLTDSYNKYPILSCPEDEGLIFHTLKGEYNEDMESHNDLIMYNEVEVKEPRTIYVVESPNGDIISKTDTLEAAKFIIYNIAPTKKDHYKIIEFIEVIKGE